jgi:hypothetical protein
MNSGRSDPPKSALWLLRRLCPKRNREAITGDLLERFGERRSTGWFWRQVLVAILVGLKPIQTALDRDLLRCSRYGLDLVHSVGADLPDCCNDQSIDELERSISMVYRNRDHDGSNCPAALRRPFSSTEDVWLGQYAPGFLCLGNAIRCG